MKGLRTFFLIAVIAVFVGSGGYLLYDSVSSARDAQDLEKLAQAVERITHTAETDREARKSSGVRVQLVKQAPDKASGQAMARDQADGQSDGPADEQADAAASVPSSPSNDAGGLAEAVQDYLQQTIMGASQSVELIRLEITPAAVDESALAEKAAPQARGPKASVRAQVSGRVGSASSRQAMEDQIELIAEQYIANDESWTVQSETIDLDVTVEPAPILPQYEALYEQNPDMIGWIKIEGTQVNYPVMQTPDDPEFYLRRNFEKGSAYSGLPFLDSRSDVSEPTHNLLVYGHNMKSGKMFGELPNYESKNFWKQHPVIQFDLLGETRTYEIIGMFRSRQYKEGEAGFRYYEYIDLSEMKQFGEFIEQVKRASFIDTGVTANWGDQILTLSTCSYHADAGTFVVVAKRQWVY